MLWVVARAVSGQTFGIGVIMKRVLLVAFLLLFAIAASAQANPALEKVLNRMDQAAAGFKSLKADFTWDVYEKVVNDTTTQQGVIYYLKTNRGVEMKADIAQPVRKYVLYANNRVQVYQPNIEQLTEYDSSKNKETFESFLVLGFGSRGHSLSDQFDVSYGGEEPVDGAKTDRLDLVPKSPKVKGMFSKISLWIDSGGVSVQQKFFEPTGDYRLVKYSKIDMNGKLPGDTFALPTTKKTKVVQAGM
jgi:outer membrane lipoprotein-sorting protein